MVHVESWERDVAEGDGDPPPPPRNGPADGAGVEEVLDNNLLQGGVEEQAPEDDEMEAGEGEVEEVEAPRQNRSTPPDSAIYRGKSVWGRAGRPRPNGGGIWRWRVTGREAGGLRMRVARHLHYAAAGGDGETGRLGGGGHRIGSWRVASGGGANREPDGSTANVGRRCHAAATVGTTAEGGGALATASGGAELECREAAEPRAGEKKIGSRVFSKMEGGKRGWGSRGFSDFPVLVLGDKTGAVSYGGGTIALVDQGLALGPQEWKLGLVVRYGLLLLSGTVVTRGGGCGSVDEGVRTWQLVLSPSHGPTCGGSLLGVHVGGQVPFGLKLLTEWEVHGWVSKSGGGTSFSQVVRLGELGVAEEDDECACRVGGVGKLTWLEEPKKGGELSLGNAVELGDPSGKSATMESRDNRVASGVHIGPRSSPRLAKGGKKSMLQRAMIRKAYQREGGEGNGVGQAENYLVRKSRLCGVSLGDAEARSFEEFVTKCA